VHLVGIYIFEHFVISDLQTTFHTQLLCTHNVQLYAQFRIPRYKRQIVNIRITARFLISLNYESCKSQEKTIDDCIETWRSNKTASLRHWIITSHHNKFRQCGAVLCNYNREKKAINIKYYDRSWISAIISRHVTRIHTASDYTEIVNVFLDLSRKWRDIIIITHKSSCKVSDSFVRI